MVERPSTVEGLVTEPSADELRREYNGRSVLVTGHTGSKGSWLTLWLHHLGARVSGLALPPPTEPSAFVDLDLASSCDHRIGDIRDQAQVVAALERSRPDVVFHLAAQAIVAEGRERPHDTFATNVGGTLNVLEAVRRAGRPCAVVVVTSDKCYAPTGGARAHREDDPLGGNDPYSASKAAAEIVTASYRHAFFPAERLAEHRIAVASARAGNVIGGGDWAQHRLVPDAMRSLGRGEAVPVRNPDHVRPWQHVLEPLSGYLLLGMRLRGPDAARACEGWNFGPLPGSERPVAEVVAAVIAAWGSGSWTRSAERLAAETAELRLDITKAADGLGWRPRWDLETAVQRTVEWYRSRHKGAGATELRRLGATQVDDYIRQG